MSDTSQFRTNLDESLAALRKDLLAEGGPQISTRRNYRFAIVPYKPQQEFELRQKVRHLSDELRAAGWNVLTISLHSLLMRRIHAMGDEALEALIAREKRLFARSPERGFNHLKDKLLQQVEGPDGIASDVVDVIGAFADEHPDQAERSLIMIGRAGSLYPFFRMSVLLKHIDGKTRTIPVVILYPGERKGLHSLSFMGELAQDSDYRPRIYP